MEIKNQILLKVDEKTDIQNGKCIIPDDVLEIGRYAFENCTSLRSVILPHNLISIGDGAFYKCTSLTNICIPNRVSYIGELAFFACNCLTKKDEKYYYKGFKADLSSKYSKFKFDENKWLEYTGELELGKKGFHACKDAFNMLDYYGGKLNEDVVFYKVELQEILEHDYNTDSKVVAKKIRLAEKINSYADLLNS